MSDNHRILQSLSAIRKVQALLRKNCIDKERLLLLRLLWQLHTELDPEQTGRTAAQQTIWGTEILGKRFGTAVR